MRMKSLKNIFLSDGCENKKCDFYSVCESDGATEGRCVCPQSCTDSKVSLSKSYLKTIHVLLDTWIEKVISKICRFHKAFIVTM